MERSLTLESIAAEGEASKEKAGRELMTEEFTCKQRPTTEAFLSRIIEEQQDELEALRGQNRSRPSPVKPVDNNLVMEISISTFIELENALLTKKKQLLERDVTITQLTAAVTAANERADATQVEWDTLRHNHNAQRLLLEQAVAAASTSHDACERRTRDLETQRATLVERCRLLALEAARYRHHQDKLKTQWTEAVQAVEGLQRDRQRQAETIHSLQTQIYALQAKGGTCPSPQSKASTMTQTSNASDLVDYDDLQRHKASRQHDMHTIVAQNQRIEELEVQNATNRRELAALQAAHTKLRGRATFWKGCIAKLVTKAKAMDIELKGATKARDAMLAEKRQFIVDYRKRKAQMLALQATLERANDQLEADQTMLAENKTRIRYYCKTIRHNAERMRELVKTCEAMQAKLATIKSRYQRSNAQRKQLAAQSSQYKSLLLEEKKERELLLEVPSALVEIDAFRKALVQVCQEAMDMPALPAQWTMEHVHAVTGIAEPLVFG
ncbi:hypothetical protein ACHHYP_09747 [Achlya hypogyna]|uniref:Uncharacterized protein n=1 Tax=Achlya hypogyna TaxID=1202772 RepID=A0A1V9YMJ5_ACHHY|nr:hypothetical protein ACHHYP_09747 [Achlya hypogyna]